MSSVVIVALILLVCFLLYLFIHYLFHTYRFGTVNMINGGVKCGKTGLAVYKSISSHKLELALYYIHKYFFDWLHIIKLIKFRKQRINVILSREKPLLYSNIPLRYKYYVPLTTAVIKRENRINYKSITLLSECSLVINSQNYTSALLNEEVELFIKLYGHMTRGGKLFIETQALSDNHYSIKRSIDNTCWIERMIKFIPFVIIWRVRKMVISDEKNVTNAFTESPDETCKTIICLSKHSLYKTYDRYCYSVFTDSKSISNNFIDNRLANSLKVVDVPTFRKFYTLNLKEVKNEQTENTECNQDNSKS